MSPGASALLVVALLLLGAEAHTWWRRQERTRVTAIFAGVLVVLALSLLDPTNLLTGPLVVVSGAAMLLAVAPSRRSEDQ